MAIGPAVLVHGMQLKRPIDVVREPSLSVDDKRTILAAWASDFYAVESKPALRQVPGTLEPISMRYSLLSKNWTGDTGSDEMPVRRPLDRTGVLSDWPTWNTRLRGRRPTSEMTLRRRRYQAKKSQG
jgi:hypothetical protein